MITQLEYRSQPGAEGIFYNKYFIGTKKDIIDAKKYIRRVKSMSRCIKCGESRPWCIQYHHRVRTTKFMGIHAMALKGFPIPLIKEELRKCDCLCANDHQEVHYRQFWINI